MSINNGQNDLVHNNCAPLARTIAESDVRLSR